MSTDPMYIDSDPLVGRLSAPGAGRRPPCIVPVAGRHMAFSSSSSSATTSVGEGQTSGSDSVRATSGAAPVVPVVPARLRGLAMANSPGAGVPYTPPPSAPHVDMSDAELLRITAQLVKHDNSARAAVLAALRGSAAVMECVAREPSSKPRWCPGCQKLKPPFTSQWYKPPTGARRRTQHKDFGCYYGAREELCNACQTYFRKQVQAAMARAAQAHRDWSTYVPDVQFSAAKMKRLVQLGMDPAKVKPKQSAGTQPGARPAGAATPSPRKRPRAAAGTAFKSTCGLSVSMGPAGGEPREDTLCIGAARLVLTGSRGEDSVALGNASSLHVVERVEHAKLYVDVHLACDTATRTAFAAGVSVTFTDGTQSVLGLVNPPAQHSLMGHEAYTPKSPQVAESVHLFVVDSDDDAPRARVARFGPLPLESHGDAGAVDISCFAETWFDAVQRTEPVPADAEGWHTSTCIFVAATDDDGEPCDGDALNTELEEVPTRRLDRACRNSGAEPCAGSRGDPDCDSSDHADAGDMGTGASL